jgi:hypothetical protein
MRFDLSKYATVAERLAKFHEDYPDGRIVTEWINNPRFDLEEKSTGPNLWVVRTCIYLSAGDQANHLIKATGHAFEIDGTGGANNGSALENAESSSIGRALMVMGYSMSKDPKTLASREEMEKVERVQNRDWLAEAEDCLSVESLRELYAQARAAGADNSVLDRLKDYGQALSSSIEDSGARGSVPGSKPRGKK